ncbi:hypothetical protein [Planotetraspora mira]|uniref:Uncharacterized protein n=1 Tax=Planotetraspora mira TaxID=58121 RepID=A0A8J3TRW1_9ACTN|nr:hypothetical protein [Planotetraspora mira]GII31393.1 hypothetical protein Pmi06nite_48350 [Planotetraspora mira]
MPEIDDKRGALTLALDHAWRWYEYHLNMASQVVNYFLIVTAVLTTAYATALSSHLYGAAVAVDLVSAVVTLATYVEGTRLRTMAMQAEEAIGAIEDQLATDLDMAALRLVELHRNRLRSRRMSFPGALAGPLALLAFLASVCGGLYALLGH